MIQRLILGIITVVLAVVIGLTVYKNFVGKTPLSQTQKPTSKVPTPSSTQPSLLGQQTQRPTAAVDNVKVFFIALSDNGSKGKRIGCGDSVVSVNKKITPTTDPLKAALETLLANKEQFNPQTGLYNAFYQSDLKLQSVSVSKGGLATVHLIGSQALSGVCDDPRIIAQLTETAKQFSSVTNVQFFINGYPIEQLLSGQ